MSELRIDIWKVSNKLSTLIKAPVAQEPGARRRSCCRPRHPLRQPLRLRHRRCGGSLRCYMKDSRSSAALLPAEDAPQICISISAKRCSTSSRCWCSCSLKDDFSASSATTRSRNRLISAVSSSSADLLATGPMLPDRDVRLSPS